QAIAQKYGGTVEPWTVRPEWKTLVRQPDHGWQVYTETDTLDVLIESHMLMSTNFERWKGSVCILRCDGQFITKDASGAVEGHACICPEKEERRELARRKPPEACEEVSRIVVMLEGIRGGQWRLDTRGFYAPAETRGLTKLLETCRVDSLVIPAQ